ncbi:lipid-A-disaccharide synthase [Alphaproteobacteria bacterium]
MSLKDLSKARIFVIAGEPSGDNLGAKLIEALQSDAIAQYMQASFGKRLKFDFYGIGGLRMKKAGCEIIFDYTNIALMGFIEVIPNILKIMERLRQCVDAIVSYRPHAIITIDSNAFNFRVVERVRQDPSFANGVLPKMIHWVAPSVWAFRSKKRAYKVGKLYDHIMLLLPFEKQYFRHMPSTFVGHPIVESKKPDNSWCVQARSKYGIAGSDMLVTIMPGSRKQEIKKHMPVLVEFIQELGMQYKALNKNIKFFIPISEQLRSSVEASFDPYKDKAWYDNVIVSVSRTYKSTMITASDLAIVKCGTSILEVMKLDVPIIAFYKLSLISAYILKLRLTIKYVTLCNLLLGSPVISELLQENFTVKNLIRDAVKFLEDKALGKQCVNQYQKVWKMLGDNEEITPSMRAARAVIDTLLSPPNSICDSPMNLLTKKGKY